MEELAFYGHFGQTPAACVIWITTLALLGFWRVPLIVWSIVVLGGLYLLGVDPVAIFVVFAVALLFNIPAIRQVLVSSIVMKIMRALKIVPNISQTERTALDAGVVWAEGELFSGKPNFTWLMNEPYPQLTPEEKAFMDGPVERLCAAIDDWDVWQKRELSKEAWDIIKKEKFLGMIIPKEYGGLGFSALAHSEVISKMASRSIPATITIMVPNSLGPAELLVHYGTEEQKKKYLSKLATGEEIPCFALTEPTAGSDAGAIQASGIIFKGPDGKLMMRLNWNKRWITLAAISTTLGLAFRLKDPDNILGKGEDLGITCALIPSNTPGVVLGKRHDPLGVPFYNCPTQGHDVVVPVDCIVGGLEGGAGKGWLMLMESLAAGRGISLPAQSIGGTKAAMRAVSAHAKVRKQFGLSIGKFEGIEEPLARIAGYTYLMEGFRRYVLGGLDQGLKPPVVTAIAKYHMTELGRKGVNDALDILGGAGISLGPRNLLAPYYMAMPIGITVEGANILTRTLIIFGQGALRAHPYAYKEVDAIERGDLKAFDRAFWGHIGHVINNTCRALILSVSRGYLASRNGESKIGRDFQKLAWISASFAILADIAMGTLGGKLKTKEKITGRFADILSWMFITTAVLRRWIADGRRESDIPFVKFATNTCYYECQRAFDGIYSNLSVPGLSWIFKGVIRSWSGLNSLGGEMPDTLTHEISDMVLNDFDIRDRLSEGIYMPTDPNQALARLERAFTAVCKAETAEKKIRKAIRTKQLPKKKVRDLIDEAVSKNVISAEEKEILSKSEELRLDAIQVDDFTQEEYVSRGAKS
ncbi:MAG: acyl-CoA dehydrogenase [Bdellovibrionales bacterium CG10_big_fil_rev_8_21_14_0_10_45_34]|nr:MAG: acyl-CoA dehydrogenase [Bdellovibrionales bacterium CG10_big_fil_rev_8_21_14_0_10_45_34]